MEEKEEAGEQQGERRGKGGAVGGVGGDQTTAVLLVGLRVQMREGGFVDAKNPTRSEAEAPEGKMGPRLEALPSCFFFSFFIVIGPSPPWSRPLSRLWPAVR